MSKKIQVVLKGGDTPREDSATEGRPYVSQSLRGFGNKLFPNIGERIISLRPTPNC